MEIQEQLFPHQVADFLGVSPRILDLLRAFELLPPAIRVSGTCIFYYRIKDLEDIRVSTAEGGPLHAKMEYLKQLDREE